MFRYFSILFIILFWQTGKAQQAPFLLPVLENGKWGFINNEGKVKVAPIFDQVGSFDGQIAIVQKDGLFYMIDSSGAFIFQEGFEDINIISKEFVAVKKKQFALADKAGKVYSEFSYAFISDLSRGNLYTLLLKSDTTSYDLFNTKTMKLLTGKFSKVVTHPKEKYIEVGQGNKVGLLDSLHNYILMPVIGEATLFDKNVPIVKTKEGFQVYSDSGKVCGDTLTWQGYTIVSNKFVLAWVHPAKKFVLARNTGKQFLFPQLQTYEELGDTPFLIVVNNKKKGLMNSTGVFVLPVENDFINLEVDNTIHFVKEGKIGLLNAEGKQLFPAQFNEVENFNKNGIALAMKDNLWGLITVSGKLLTPFKYDDIEITSETWKAYRGSSMDLYNLKTPTQIDETIHFNEVGSIRARKRITKNYEFTNFFDSKGKGSGIVVKSKKGNYKLTSKPYEYPAKFKLKCLIYQNFRNINNLYGAYSFVSQRLLASNKYWDIQIDELEDQEYARIILPGDWQGLLGRNGSLKLNYAVTKSGKEVQTPITYIGPFVNGLARINLGGIFIYGSDIKDSNRVSFSNNLSCQGGLWGYVNGNGDMFIKANLEYASDFMEGRAIVKIKGKYGVIDTLNQFVIKPEYDFISALENSNNKYFKLVKKKTEEGLLNDKGKVIIKAEYDDMHPQNENRISIKKDGLWGVCNFSGDIIIPFKYDYLSVFREGRCNYMKKNKWGFVDSIGTELTNPVYSEVNYFSDGYAAVKEKGKWGFINGSGVMVIKPTYSRANSFKNGVASVYLKKKWWFIDKKGRKIAHHWFTKVSEFDEYGLAIVKRKRKNLVIRQDGKIILAGKYKAISPFSEGMACVKNKKNKYGFIDTLGKLIIPTIYFGAGNFSEGLARVRYVNGKWGYINKKNDPKIGAEYNRADDFSEGKVTVTMGKNTIVIDSFGIRLFELPENTLGKYQEGMLLIKGTYYNLQGKKEMGPYDKATPFKNGLAKVYVTKGNALGNHLINRKNISIANYASINNVEHHLAIFTIFSRIGLADSNGKIIAVPTYQGMKYIGSGIFQVNYFDEIGYIQNDGSWLWKPTR